MRRYMVEGEKQSAYVVVNEDETGFETKWHGDIAEVNGNIFAPFTWDKYGVWATTPDIDMGRV